MNFTEIVSSIGISGAMATLVLWGAAKFLGAKWAETLFAGRLETLKIEGQKQIEHIRQESQRELEGLKQEHASHVERLRFERADKLDRAAKLNQREFEIIPDIWLKATEAHYAVAQMISMFQSGPDLSRMPPAQFEAFLEKSRLEDWQRDEIRTKNSFERSTYYSEAARWHRLSDANVALIEFNRAFLGSSIFVHPETFSKFQEFADALHGAFNRFKVNMQMGDDYRRHEEEKDNPVDLYREKGSALYDDLASYLRERYWITAEGKAV